MRIGTFIPNLGDLPATVGLTAMAVAAEEAGAQSLWVGDHVLMADDPASRYPYSRDGRRPYPIVARGDSGAGGTPARHGPDRQRAGQRPGQAPLGLGRDA